VTVPPPSGHVTIREVCLRDGLQNEDPIPLSAKLALLEAVVATGVREVEATAFVSASKVPALADAAALAAELPRFRESHGVEFSALVAGPGGAGRAVAAGMESIEYVVSAADGHSHANVGRSTAESTDLITDITRIAHECGATIEVIIATAWDCPFDGPTDPRRVRDIAAAAVEIGAGAGLASAHAAVAAGVRRLDSSVGGLGGCPFAPGASGNIATEDLVYLLRDCGIGIDLDLPAAIQAAEVARHGRRPRLAGCTAARGRPPPELTDPVRWTTKGLPVDFSLPERLPALLTEMNAVIEAEMAPLQAEHVQYFDRRREYAETDWKNGERSLAFGLSEPNHGSDATWLQTTAAPAGDGPPGRPGSRGRGMPARSRRASPRRRPPGVPESADDTDGRSRHCRSGT
jgi:hydroxymethylglutaryl-CoA lyase